MSTDKKSEYDMTPDERLWFDIENAVRAGEGLEPFGEGRRPTGRQLDWLAKIRQTVGSGNGSRHRRPV